MKETLSQNPTDPVPHLYLFLLKILLRTFVCIFCFISPCSTLWTLLEPSFHCNILPIQAFRINLLDDGPSCPASCLILLPKGCLHNLPHILDTSLHDAHKILYLCGSHLTSQKKVFIWIFHIFLSQLESRVSLCYLELYAFFNINIFASLCPLFPSSYSQLVLPMNWFACLTIP